MNVQNISEAVLSKINRRRQNLNRRSVSGWEEEKLEATTSFLLKNLDVFVSSHSLTTAFKIEFGNKVLYYCDLGYTLKTQLEFFRKGGSPRRAGLHTGRLLSDQLSTCFH